MEYKLYPDSFQNNGKLRAIEIYQNKLQTPAFTSYKAFLKKRSGTSFAVSFSA